MSISIRERRFPLCRMAAGLVTGGASALAGVGPVGTLVSTGVNVRNGLEPAFPAPSPTQSAIPPEIV